MARAEAACLKLNAEIASEPVKSSGNRSIAHFAPKNKLLEEQALRELRALKAPIKSHRAWSQTLALREELARELGELGNAAKRNDSRSVHELVAQKASTHAKLSRTAGQAGLKQCAHVG